MKGVSKMLKYISLLLLIALSGTAQAETLKLNNFTMSELENIEYTATLSYIPKDNDIKQGYKKGVPVKLIHQTFMLDYKDDNRNITKLKSTKNELGTILITYEDPEQLGISSLDKGKYKGMFVIMDSEKNKKIDNYTDYKLKLNIYTIDQRLHTQYTASFVDLYEDPDLYKVTYNNLILSNEKGKRYDIKQRVVLAPNKPKFITPKGEEMGIFIVELEARAVSKYHK